MGDELATTATAGLNSVDDGGDQRQEAAGDEVDDPETLEAEWDERGRNCSEKFPKNLPLGIYRTTRWHRDALLQAVTATR